MPAAAIGPAIGGVTSLLGGILGSNAAGQASAKISGTMGRNAEQLAQVGQQQLKPELAQLAPYIQGGQQASNTLAGLLRTPGQGLLQGYGAFQAPTGVDYTNDPGYQFRLQQGVSALQNSAAARGDLLSGNTLQAVTQLGQGLGSEEYGNVFQRALQSYGANANTFYQNQGNQFSRLMGTAGMGLNAAQLSDQARQNYVGTYGQAMDMSNQGAGAAAQGIANRANIWGNAIGNIGGWGQNLASLLTQPQPGGGGGIAMSPGYLSQVSQLPLAGPSGNAAYGLGSSVTGGGFGIGGYGVGYPYNQSGF